MKRDFYKIASMILVLGMLSSCGSSADQEELERLRAENESLKAQITEETTVLSESSVDNNVTTDTETETTVSEKTVWNQYYFVDEWGDEDKSSPYMATITDNGKFSNSVTVNSDLTTVVIVSPYYIAFKLIEYGWSEQVSSSGETYDIEIVDENNETTSITGEMAKGSNQLIVNDYYKVMLLLKNNSTLKFKLKSNAKYGNSSYSFKLDCTGFENSYNELKSK